MHWTEGYEILDYVLVPFFLNIYLKGRELDLMSAGLLPGCLIIARIWPGWIQEPRTHSRYPREWQGEYLSHYCSYFPCLLCPWYFWFLLVSCCIACLSVWCFLWLYWSYCIEAFLTMPQKYCCVPLNISYLWVILWMCLITDSNFDTSLREYLPGLLTVVTIFPFVSDKYLAGNTLR